MAKVTRGQSVVAKRDQALSVYWTSRLGKFIALVIFPLIGAGAYVPSIDLSMIPFLRSR